MIKYLLLMAFFLSTLISCDGIGYSNKGNSNSLNNTTLNNTTNNTTNNSTNTSDPLVDDDQDGYNEIEGDCDDSNPDINPGEVEICDDGIDNNCNNAIDNNEPDGDGDGYGPCAGDCNDSNPDINPSSPEIPDDGIDNNCDGITDADFDGDGYTVEDGDCDDSNSEVHPGAIEDCFDGVDNDCNGFIDTAEPDLDGDGAGPCNGDCAENDPTRGPFNAEIPGDGIDNNCDFLIDEDIDGDGWTVENGDCDDNDPTRNPAALETCGDGIDNDCDGIVDSDCLTPCEIADMTRSSVGCVYYAIDTNNDPVENYDALQFAVVISNTDPTQTANVDVLSKSGNTWTVVETSSVAPGTLYQFNLPDRHVNYTNFNVGGAYKIVSDLPVIAYQFQPVNGQSSYTSDASLLLPASSLDRFYYVVGWGIGYGNPQINIAAIEDGTVINITSSQNTSAGGTMPALTANVPYTFTQVMNEGDYVQIETPGDNSFSGTYIESNHPISVFSTHWCANIPAMGCCCDHLEEQLIGLQSWGNVYVAARMPVRNTGTPEATIWQVFASEDNTNIWFTASPEVTGLPASPITLNAGQMQELTISGSIANPGDFIVTADKPILVMEYLSSSYYTNASTDRAGDPAMTQMVPVAQFLDSYIVLVPSNWIYDHAILIKPVGSNVLMDGTVVAQSNFTPINDGVNPVEWEVARISVGDGIHTFDGDAPFGIVVLGYDSYDSYAYPGGLNMQIINPIN
ncbi:MAG: hypothetical protein JXR95_14225 [Deltaproteobacteria bacterium]|nr:hypothetical protein [Deltaproteobacteria bacterium]